VVSDTYGEHEVKLPAGDPTYREQPARSACHARHASRIVFPSAAVRDDVRRRLLFDMDTSIQTLTATRADAGAVLTLTSTYHNLLRLWAET
jgi:PKHD-type hydroxylase